MTAFPGIKSYFDKCSKFARRNGYILINEISGRKSYINFFPQYQDLQQKINVPCFWDDYRYHKQQKTDMFKSYYKPLVREYSKFQGTIDRHSFNYPVQGTGADITKLAVVKFFDLLVAKKLVKIVLIPNVIHDEVLVECPENLKVGAASILKECMENAGKVFCKLIPLTTDPCITPVWKH